MLIVLSPSKALNFAPVADSTPMTTPELKDDIAELARTTRKLRALDLKRMMDISDKLATLNRDRFQAFDPACEDGLQAAMAFNGDVYMGLQARTLDRKALSWAQAHIRILSGLYGVLRPLDAIQPYRLEMGVRLKTKRGANLYDFWGARIAERLNELGEGDPEPVLVNLSSQEYFGAVDLEALKLPLVTCRFLEEKDGEARTISFFAKKARGLMARFAAETRPKSVQALKKFNLADYSFRPEASDETDWVFARPQPPLKS